MSSISTANKENRRKTLIVYSIFGVLMIVFIVYAYESFFATVPPPTGTATPVVVTKPSGSTNGTFVPTKAGQTANTNQPAGAAMAPGVAATRMASTSSSLDPTLDQTAMLRTESLVYSGSGRNIFSMTYVAAASDMPKNVPPARPVKVVDVGPPVPTGPPPPPPINIKFFGTVTNAAGKRQAFLLQGEDVYLASQGDIVARKYRIASITGTNIQVEDLSNNNTQTLPLQAN
jgi:hypothetical protein